MSEEIKKAEEKAAINAGAVDELSNSDLDKVAGGGKATFEPFTITKPIDTSSP